VRELDAELARTRQTLKDREGHLSRLQTELQAARSELASRDGKKELSGLQRELADAREAHAGCATEGAKLRGQIEELQEKLRARAAPSDNGAPSWLLSSCDGEKDDLQAIRGLGPVLERGLNDIGIYHYRQLARMTHDDIEWLAPRINVFPGRIIRDEWAAQAKRMHFRKYNERL
jgi:predicted flap endonuclease-1-like 5' DNA nuclease